ncbi:hypothetical protein RFI_14862 [Reticulomyxa filosa]|uniref:ATPase AAA-type core domain-containing protein n=1 Tax=Reticulomyxa filosa TaxID=46433 RepID=X6N8H0_RETFI|nr:hypothetical protein RFI_14862 [Reticulomyxa filosa]|eukprot:ETO22336.1 hypothetical protein RFI_14862 [Reticulomyxa filosa]
MTPIDVHGGYRTEQLEKDLRTPRESAESNPNKIHLVFLDEINTSPDIGAFKEVVCDHSFKGKAFPENMVIVAALNPYRKHKKTREEIEAEKEESRNTNRHFLDNLDKEMSELVYRVFPLPRSMKTYVWNFGSLSDLDEMQYISLITEHIWYVTNMDKLHWSEKNKNDPEAKERMLQGLGNIKHKFVECVFNSQSFLRKTLGDRSVCSLRDVQRVNNLFVWFYNSRSVKNIEHMSNVMILALAQCYYYRLNANDRRKYVEMAKKELADDFENVIEREQQEYLYKMEIPHGIACNQIFRENIFIFLWLWQQRHLRLWWVDLKLNEARFGDFFVISFQCSKLTTSEAIRERWENAIRFVGRLRDHITTLEKNVVLVLDEMGLAEQSNNRPLKVLHQLLENENRQIAFIGLSNWRLDAAKMNRVVLHQVLQPTKKELEDTANKILCGNESSIASGKFTVKVPRITAFFEEVMKTQNESAFSFDFFGQRDFYSLLSYLGYCVEIGREATKEVLIEAIMRNFGGMSQKQTESFLFPKIVKNLLESGEELNSADVWKSCSPLKLINDNIKQMRSVDKSPTYDMRNIMLITESPFLWKILFDSGIILMDSAEVIFGSRFVGDVVSTQYLYHVIEKVRNAMNTGKTCVLLKLERLYDSLYDVLNQRYQVVDGQKLRKFLQSILTSIFFDGIFFIVCLT